MVRLLIAIGAGRERELLREAAIGHDEISLVGVARDGQEAVQMAVQYQPDIVVLTDDLKVLTAYEAAGLISSAVPSVKPVLVVDHDSTDVTRRAMRVGVRQCLARPVTPRIILEAAVEVAALDGMQTQPEYQSALDPERYPRIIAVTGAKGGVGKTSLSTNTAVTLARMNRGPTCMVDLYTQFGDVATLLNVHARQTLVDLVNMDEDLDLDMVTSAAVPHPSGLHVLLGSGSPHSLDALPSERLDQVFAALRLRYRFIVVDVPPMLHEHTLHVLENAHQVLLVCNLQDLTTVTDTSRLVKAIKDTYVPKERLKLVLNRVSRQNQLAIELVEKSLGLNTWMQVPNDEQLVSACTNRGVPYVLDSPNHPVSQAVHKIAASLAEAPSSVAQQAAVVAHRKAQSVAQPERRGLFGFLGRRAASQG